MVSGSRGSCGQRVERFMWSTSSTDYWAVLQEETKNNFGIFNIEYFNKGVFSVINIHTSC